jgi:superfamily II DNA/RNA helicase
MTFIKQIPEVWQNKWQTSGFSEPSFIQQASFQPLKEKRNVLGLSPTGTGKTLAYLLPLLLNLEKGQGSQLLILAPSQELAMQIAAVAKEWAQLLQLQTQTLIGGANVTRQIERLKKRPEILIGTPGRVLELMKNKKVKSHLLKTIVMDEVDQLFHETEANLTQQILNYSGTEYQLVFYSATADRVIDKAKEITDSLEVIDASLEDTSAGQVSHYFLRLAPRKRAAYLRSLAYTPDFRGIVFFNQLAELGTIEEKLLFDQVPVVGLASDQSKQARKLAIDQFKTKRATMLLTTDVAARGLDFADIPYVINLDVPLSPEGYLHRAGRVGRMGAAGKVITFVNDATQRDYQRLMKQLTYQYQEIYLYDGALHVERKEKKSELTAAKKESVAKKTAAISFENEKPAKSIKKSRTKNKKNKGARKK